MRTFTRVQIETLNNAVCVYEMRELQGMKWAEISKVSHYSLRQCHYLYDYAEKALNRLHGFDHHGSY